jgi:hypothetical protein
MMPIKCIFYITHNVQLGYDYNCVNLIRNLHRVAKIQMLNVKWWTLSFPCHISNNITSCFVGGCIRHQSFKYHMSYHNVIYYIVS